MSEDTDGSENDYEESDNDYYTYDDADIDLDLPKESSCLDAERFKFKLCNHEDVESIINKSVEELCTMVDLPPAICQILLIVKQWDVKKVETLVKTDLFKLLSDVQILPTPGSVISSTDSRAVQLAVQTAQRLSSHNSTYRPLLRLKSPLNGENLCEVCFTEQTPSPTG
ncbi:hypothetical protein Ciccas_006087 [Cichlidogyrus casuarinus]|uniref:Uncharacterized protein n=1 Tax=Cichlidogyrus casuarinus TaxID=1844966 RepID=A0ABD2Q6T7_9PLAT